jgi:putative heme-binding domain-containing protein
MNVNRGTGLALQVIRSAPNETAALETWRSLFQLKGAADQAAALLKVESPKSTAPAPADSKPISGMIASAGLRAARELGKKGENVAANLARLAGVDPTAAKPAENYQSIAEFVKRDGDPSRGEEIYRRAQLGCVTCHAIGGAGGKVGPELTSMGASAPMDYIIESIIDPTAKVKEGFHAVLLTLKDGTVASGIQSRETPEEIFLRDVIGQESAIPKAKLASRETVGSIMPASLVDSLQSREKLDLYAVLGQLGKPGVYDASKGTVARFWALSAQQPDASKPDALKTATPSYTLVDGRLTRELLQSAVELLPGHGDQVFATARLHVASDAKTRIDLTGVTKAWLDGKPLAVASEPGLTAEMNAGEHLLTVELDMKNAPAVLRAESADVRFLGN